MSFTQGLYARADLRRVDCVRPLAHQTHDHRVVAAVTDTGSRQRSEQLHFYTTHLLQLVLVPQRLDEQRRRAHRPDGVGTGRADADFEQVENADSHCCRAPEDTGPGRKSARWRSCYAQAAIRRNARIIRLLSERTASDTDALMSTSAAPFSPRFFAVFVRFRWPFGAEKSCKRRH
ncbi:hypothetical protein D3C81_1179680 [compost metagenome]